MARMADASDGKARGFGVTREIHDIADYSLPQAWAGASHAAAFDGVRYLATNHQPTSAGPSWEGHGAQGPGSWALFGRTGLRGRWRRGRAERIDSALLDRLKAEVGIIFVDPPTVASARIVQPPS